jgi:polyhydroxybutyrate depolymerase
MIKQKKLLILCVVTLVLLSISYLNVNVFETEYSVGDYTGSIIFDGLERTYRIHIPSLYDKDKPMPLVIVLHGSEGSAKSMENLSGFNTLSDKEGFIVVYPNAIEKHWNDGLDMPQYRSNRENIDDVGFISILIDYLIKELNIDKKRIYVTGMSNGAIMSHRLACEVSERIAAIAPVVGAMPEKVVSHCSPSRPISVLIINSVDDPIVSWEGIELEDGTPVLLSVPSTVRY